MTDVVARLNSLRQHQAQGQRAPHKPLLVLMSLGNLMRTGSSAVPWSQAETQLAELLASYGRPSRTSPAQSAAYPFTRLRNDKVWELDRDITVDSVSELRKAPVTGRLESELEAALLADPRLQARAARMLVEAHFPDTVARDLLVEAGLDPDVIFANESVELLVKPRHRSGAWPVQILEAWDRQCAFCGYDGLLAGASVGVEAAHVRWFNHDGPDDLDNGLALCSLHHKLFDRGVLGLDDQSVVRVSAAYTARTPSGRAVYELHGVLLRPRPGTLLPARQHLEWHRREVFKGRPLAA